MNHYPMYPSSHSVRARSCISVLVRDCVCVQVQVQVKDCGPRPSRQIFGLVWFGLVWFGLVWFFQTNSRRIAAPEYAFVVLGGLGSASNAGGSVRRIRPEWWADSDPSFGPSLMDPTLTGHPDGRDSERGSGWHGIPGPR